MSKVLFVLRRKEDYNDKTDYSIGLSTGLYNSASFVNNMLNDNGIDSNIEVVLDNNCIDRVITLHKPDYCIIEALLSHSNIIINNKVSFFKCGILFIT